MQAKLFTYPVTIRESHLDTFGHMNNTAYLALLEEARWDLLNMNDYGVAMIKKTELGPTILEITIRFTKELFVRDNVIITTQLKSYAGKIAKVEHRVLRNDVVCCTALFTIGLFDLQQRKLILPTPEWLRALGVEQN